MPTLTYDYVVFATGSHRRQPRGTAGPGGFNLIKSIPGGSPASGGTFVAGAQPQTLTVNGQTYNFAFTSVTGGTPAGQTSTDSETPPPGITVGSNPITVLVVYVPIGGGGASNDYGATIDAFDETTGALIDDTFVKVSPDTNGSLTSSANVFGYVDTTNSAETITALTPTSPSHVDFDKWVSLDPPRTQSNVALNVAQATSVVALAFYKAPPPPSPAQTTCNQTVAGVNKILAEGPNGPLFTAAEWTQVLASLHKCVAEGYLSEASVNALIARYEEYVKTRGNTPTGKPKPV